MSGASVGSFLSPRAREFQHSASDQYGEESKFSATEPHTQRLSPFAQAFAPTGSRCQSHSQSQSHSLDGGSGQGDSQHPQHGLSSPALSSSSASSQPDDSVGASSSMYKTELCRSFVEVGCCRYGAKCRFAHGWSELRPVQRHRRFKTELCKNYQRDGFCPYGARCRFIHNTETADREEIRSVSTEDWEQMRRQVQKSSNTNSNSHSTSPSDSWKVGSMSPIAPLITAHAPTQTVVQPPALNSSSNSNWRSPIITSPTDSPWTSHSNSVITTPLLFDSNMPSPLTPSMRLNDFSIPSSAKSPSFAPLAASLGYGGINRIRPLSLLDSPRTLSIVHDDNDDDDEDLSRWSHSPHGRSLIHHTSVDDLDTINGEQPITALRTLHEDILSVLPSELDGSEALEASAPREIPQGNVTRALSHTPRPRVSSSASTFIPMLDSMSPLSSDSLSGSFSSLRRHRGSHDLLTDAHEDCDRGDEDATQFYQSPRLDPALWMHPHATPKLQIIDDRCNRFHQHQHTQCADTATAVATPTR